MNKDDAATPIQDDAELAKVLDGINGQNDGASLPAPADGLQFEETPAAAPAAPADQTAITPPPAPASDAPYAEPTMPEIPSVEVVADEPVYASPTSTPVAGPLEDIKKHALEELRPLVDKLDLPADEKFDTLLLIIRSTDDQSLVSACYEAAKMIEDENRRAQALLDVIKEIDYFANQK